MSENADPDSRAAVLEMVAALPPLPGVDRYFDADLPQRAVCRNQGGRAECISDYDSVVHHLQTWG